MFQEMKMIRHYLLPSYYSIEKQTKLINQKAKIMYWVNQTCQFRTKYWVRNTDGYTLSGDIRFSFLRKDTRYWLNV